MRLRAELRCPLEVFAGLGVKRTGQTLLLRQHVARPSLSPLRLVRSRHAEIFSSQKQAGTKQPAPNSKPPAATTAAAQEVEQHPLGANPTAFHGRKSAGNVPLPEHPKLMTLQDLFGNIVILHAQAKDGFALGMRDEGVKVVDVELGFEESGHEVVQFRG